MAPPASDVLLRYSRKRKCKCRASGGGEEIARLHERFGREILVEGQGRFIY